MVRLKPSTAHVRTSVSGAIKQEKRPDVDSRPSRWCGRICIETRHAATLRSPTRNSEEAKRLRAYQVAYLYGRGSLMHNIGQDLNPQTIQRLAHEYQRSRKISAQSRECSL